MSGELIIDQTAIEEVARYRQQVGDDQQYLRVRIEGGGCAGFRYEYSWDAKADGDDDNIFADAVVIDELSLKYMPDAVVKFHNDMMGRMFKIDNPLANSACGCGTSFSV